MDERRRYALTINSVGIAYRKNLQWLIRFAKSDLSQSQQATTFRYEARVFAMLGSLQEFWRDESWDKKARPLRNRLSTNLAYAHNENPHSFPSPAVAELRKLVERSLDEYRTRGRTTLPTITIEQTISKHDRGGITYTWPSSVSRVNPQSNTAAFIVRLGETLRTEGWRLGRCTVCNQIFIMNRVPQQYCSRQCGMRVVMRNRRKRLSALRARKSKS
jgi:hypothetical protein